MSCSSSSSTSVSAAPPAAVPLRWGPWVGGNWAALEGWAGGGGVRLVLAGSWRRPGRGGASLIRVDGGREYVRWGSPGWWSAGVVGGHFLLRRGGPVKNKQDRVASGGGVGGGGVGCRGRQSWLLGRWSLIRVVDGEVGDGGDGGDVDDTLSGWVFRWCGRRGVDAWRSLFYECRPGQWLPLGLLFSEEVLCGHVNLLDPWSCPLLPKGVPNGDDYNRLNPVWADKFYDLVYKGGGVGVGGGVVGVEPVIPMTFDSAEFERVEKMLLESQQQQQQEQQRQEQQDEQVEYETDHGFTEVSQYEQVEQVDGQSLGYVFGYGDVSTLSALPESPANVSADEVATAVEDFNVVGTDPAASSMEKSENNEKSEKSEKSDKDDKSETLLQYCNRMESMISVLLDRYLVSDGPSTAVPCSPLILPCFEEDVSPPLASLSLVNVDQGTPPSSQISVEQPPQPMNIDQVTCSPVEQSPVIDEPTLPTMKTVESTLPMVIEEPVKSVESTLPMVEELVNPVESTLPMVIEEHVKPVEIEELVNPVESTLPMVIEEPVKSVESTLPLVIEEHVKPVEIEEPVKSVESTLPLVIEEHVKPVEIEELVNPVESTLPMVIEEPVNPVESTLPMVIEEPVKSVESSLPSSSSSSSSSSSVVATRVEDASQRRSLRDILGPSRRLHPTFDRERWLLEKLSLSQRKPLFLKSQETRVDGNVGDSVEDLAEKDEMDKLFSDLDNDDDVEDLFLSKISSTRRFGYENDNENPIEKPVVIEKVVVVEKKEKKWKEKKKVVEKKDNKDNKGKEKKKSRRFFTDIEVEGDSGSDSDYVVSSKHRKRSSPSKRKRSVDDECPTQHNKQKNQKNQKKQASKSKERKRKRDGDEKDKDQPNKKNKTKVVSSVVDSSRCLARDVIYISD